MPHGGNCENERTSQITYPFVMNYLPKEFVKKAEVELNDIEELRDSKLKELRQLVESEATFKDISISDEYLLIYLRGRKFNVQKALKSLKALVESVRNHKQNFEPIKPSVFKTYVTQKMSSFLPYRDKDGCVIHAFIMGNWPVDLDLNDFRKCDILSFLTALTYPMTQVNGVQVLFDFKGNHLKHMRYCTPYQVYLTYHTFQEVIPMRVKAIHILHPSLLFRAFYYLALPVVPEKLKNRVFVHQNVASLQKYFPSSILPRSLGGQIEDYDISEWLSKATLPEFVRRLVNNN